MGNTYSCAFDASPLNSVDTEYRGLCGDGIQFQSKMQSSQQPLTDFLGFATDPSFRLKAPRVAFVSIFCFYCQWRDIPFSVLYSCVCVFNCPRNHILDDGICGDNGKPRAEECIDGDCICHSIHMTEDFKSVLISKETQGLLIWIDPSFVPSARWVVDQLAKIPFQSKAINAQNSSHIRNHPILPQIREADPRWMQLITPLSVIIDPMTGAPYNALNLDPNWWQSRYGCKSVVTESNIDEWAQTIDGSDDINRLYSNKVMWQRLMDGVSQIENCHSLSKLCRDIKTMKYRFSTLSEIIHQSCHTLIPMVTFDSDKYETKAMAIQYYTTLYQSNIAIDIESTVGSPSSKLLTLAMDDITTNEIVTQKKMELISAPPQRLIHKLLRYRRRKEFRDSDGFHYFET